MGQWMAQWVPILVLASPLAIKVIQLKVFRLGGDGLVYMEFDSIFKVRCERPTEKALTKKVRKQVKQ